MASRALSLSKIGRAGRALVRDARVGRFSQVWVVRSDHLGRDAFELLRIWRVFESIGISLRATDENIDDPFYFDIHAVIAANERRKFLERSAEGMNRAAKEGRYTGGIVPLGYSVSGDRGCRRLVPDDSPMWAGLSAADVVRRIYHHLASDGWTCPHIASEFNSLGIPTSYRREIVQLLVRRITVHTTLTGRGRKQVRVVIDYRFPRVGEARTGIAASHGYNLRRVIAA